MLAIDVPIATLAGLVLAEGGRGMIESQDEHKTAFMRVVVLMFGAIFITPTPFYYFLGWPSWETNYLWQWVDQIYDSPIRAAFSYVLFALAIIPAYLGFELGRYFILKGKAKWVRISYIALLVLVGAIVFLMREATFNVSSTYAAHHGNISSPFMQHPFVTGWVITSLYFWGALAIFYFWLRKK